MDKAPSRRLVADVSVPAIVAGFVTVLVGFSSSVAIVFAGATAVGANSAQIASWIWALGMGMGLTCFALSWRYRMPVITAWSTPGAALLAAAGAGHLSLAQATGAFLICAGLSTIAGFSGAFTRLMDRVPSAFGSALLVGLLLRFAIKAFADMPSNLPLSLAMLGSYVLMRRLQGRYAVPVTLLLGTVISLYQGQGSSAWSGQLSLSLAQPLWCAPEFTLAALIGTALPLFVVTMASQNIPGVAAQRSQGFHPPISKIIGWIGVVNLVLAPLGCYAINLAAITAAICTGPEAHPDPQRRYIAGMATGIFYILVGIFGATVAALLHAMPTQLIAMIAGLALLGTIGNGLHQALADEKDREAALVCLLITVSGLTLFGIGSAFWGLVLGLSVRFILRARS
jgi:benzoate membrane transport protein